MGRFVLALHDAGGTVPPMLAIAEALTGRGHAVTVLSQPCVEHRARRAGCDFVAFSLPDYATDRPIEDQIDVALPMMTGRGPGEELLRTIERTGAGAVVVDANLAGVAAAAEAADCRSAILFHSLYETYVDTWFGELWPFLAPAINETRTAFGLAERASWTEVFEPHDRLYAVVPEVFDAPTRVPAPRRCSTPASSSRQRAAPRPHPCGGGDGAPIVLVSLSTTDMGQGPLLQTVLDALDGLDVRGVVTTGGQRFGSLRVPPNVELHDYLAHAAVLPHAAAVITHAGLGTVAAALSHGVPVVCTPIARDQPLNASRVVAVGAGTTVTASTATPEAVRAALHEVLTEARYRENARRIAEASSRAGGAAAVADDLERLSR